MHASICGGHITAAKALVAAGADCTILIDRKTFHRSTRYLSGLQYKDLVTHLLIAGAGPNNPAGPEGEDSPLDMAIGSGNEKIASALLCNPNTNYCARGPSCRSPLMAASKKDDASIVEVLLAAGADVHYRIAPFGDSALDMAAESGNTHGMAAILRHAPDVDSHVDMEGHTPLHTGLLRGCAPGSRIRRRRRRLEVGDTSPQGCSQSFP